MSRKASKKEHIQPKELVPWKKCQECKQESVLTHTDKGYCWCFKCGHYEFNRKN